MTDDRRVLLGLEDVWATQPRRAPDRLLVAVSTSVATTPQRGWHRPVIRRPILSRGGVVSAAALVACRGHRRPAGSAQRVHRAGRGTVRDTDAQSDPDPDPDLDVCPESGPDPDIIGGVRRRADRYRTRWPRDPRSVPGPGAHQPVLPTARHVPHPGSAQRVVEARGLQRDGGRVDDRLRTHHGLRRGRPDHPSVRRRVRVRHRHRRLRDPCIRHPRHARSLGAPATRVPSRTTSSRAGSMRSSSMSRDRGLSTRRRDPDGSPAARG